MRKKRLEITPEEVRAIRKGLGLTQVEAGELLGGGPRAFTKYEAGTVKPAAAVINLLRLLEADPAALATLGGRKPRPMAAAGVGPFEVTGEHVAVLTERELPQLLRYLLSAEAQAHGLPLSGIHVPPSIHTPDGGEDGRIEWTGDSEPTPFLPPQLCLFQSKSGSIGPKAAGREVLTEGGAVKDRVRAALEAGGCYIVLCGHSYVQRQIEDREQSIRESLRGAGLIIDDGQVDFRDADQIADWANHHPSVATWLKEQTQPGTLGPFRSWSHWAGRHARRDDPPWVEDERLPGLRAWLRKRITEPRNVCRIVGSSGIGKSRLTLEALGPAGEDEVAGCSLSDLVLYAVESEVGSEAVNGVVQTLADGGQRAVVVVDRCAPETHRILAGMVLHRSSRLSLVTIDDEVPTGTPDKTTVEIPKAPSAVTEAIINHVLPGLPSEDRWRLERFSEGFPRIAVLVGKAWTESRPIAHVIEDDLVDAFILGRSPREPELLLKSAALLATFGLITVEPEGDQLGEIAARGRGLTAADLRVAVSRLIDRGTAQRRGRSVILQPRPVAMKLAERQWREEWSQEEQRDDVLAGNASPDLKVLAARQLAQLNTTEVAQEVVRHVCRSGGPFDDIESVFRPGHAEVLSALAGVDTELVADRIERFLDDVKDLSMVGGAVHGDLVCALEKIAFHPDSFEAGARLLLRLAVSENEMMWGNNATGRFKDLFPVLSGNTAADGNARLSVLDEATETDNPTERLIVVEALIAGSGMDHFSRFVGPESHGPRPALEPWRPATKGEVMDYIEGCVTRLSEFSRRDNECGVTARRSLGRNLRRLVGSGFIDAMETVVRQVGTVVGYWPEALEGLGQFLRYDACKTDQEAANRVRTLIAELTPQSLESRVRFLVTEMPWDYPCDEDLDFETRDKRQVEVVRGLAAELVRQPALLDGFLPQLSRGGQRTAYAFGEAVAGHADSPLDWLEPIILAVVEKTPESERNYDLLSGYVAGIAEDYPDIVEALKQRAAQSPELAPALPLICWRLGITASDIDLVIDALRAGRLPPPALMQWTSGRVLAEVPAPLVAPLVDVMLDHGAGAFEVALGLMVSCAHGTPGKIAGLRPQIRKSVENFTRWKQLRKQQGAAADFELIVHWMLEQGRDDGDARATALALAKALVNDEDDSGEDFIEPVIPMLLSGFPEIVWPLIGQAIVSDRQQEWRLAHVLRGRLPADGEINPVISNPVILSLPEDTLFAWCHAHPDRAPAFAAGVVPVLTSREVEASEQSLHPVMVRLVDEFGNREGVLQAMLDNMHNFTWSGSLASHFALYEEPLRALRDHPKPKVRRWARATLRGLGARVETVHEEEEERKARWEA